MLHLKILFIAFNGACLPAVFPVAPCETEIRSQCLIIEWRFFPKVALCTARQTS